MTVSGTFVCELAESPDTQRCFQLRPKDGCTTDPLYLEFHNLSVLADEISEMDKRQLLMLFSNQRKQESSAVRGACERCEALCTTDCLPREAQQGSASETDTKEDALADSESIVKRQSTSSAAAPLLVDATQPLQMEIELEPVLRDTLERLNMKGAVWVQDDDGTRFQVCCHAPAGTSESACRIAARIPCTPDVRPTTQSCFTPSGRWALVSCMAACMWRRWSSPRCVRSGGGTQTPRCTALMLCTPGCSIEVHDPARPRREPQ